MANIEGGDPQLIEDQAVEHDETVTAKELAESLLVWAKERNLFAKIPTDEAIDSDGGSSGVLPPRMQATPDVADILQRRAINLIAFNEEQRKVTVFTNGKLNQTEIKLLPFVSQQGIQIEYVQGGAAQVRPPKGEPLQPYPYTLRGEFVTCGSSIHPVDAIGAGTMGVLVADQSGQMFALTNNHVSGACNHAVPGLPILCPGPLDARESELNPFTLGRHEKLLPIHDGLPENIDTLANCDAALIRIVNTDRVTSWQGSNFDTPPNVAAPIGGMRVEKVGRTTGHTAGTVVGFPASPVPVAYAIPEYGIRKNVFFNDFFIIEGDNGAAFSRGGDSGSLVVGYLPDGSKTSVGLIFAGDEERGLSFALKLDNILNLLGVSIVASHNSDAT